MTEYLRVIRSLSLHLRARALMNAIAYKLLPRSEVLAYEPITLNTLVTLRCNLSCPICLLANIRFLNIPYKIPKDLTFTDFSMIVDKFGKYLISVIFSGGEPLLNKELFKMARFASSKRLSTELFTNGLLIGEHIPKILEYIDSITVSFNAADAKEYHQMHNAPPKLFEVLIGNTVKLIDMKDKLKKPLIVTLSYVCTKNNFKRIPDFIELAESLGVNEVNFRTLCSFGLPEFSEDQCLYRDDVEVAEFINGIKPAKRKMKILLPKLYERTAFERDCKAPFSFLTVDGDGDIFPCCCPLPRSNGKYGNIFSSEDIWNSKVFRDLRKRLIDKSLPLPELCLRCNARFLKRRIIGRSVDL